MNKAITATLFLIAGSLVPVRATALGDLVSTMQPGTWKDLTGTNLDPSMLTANSDGSQNILEYTDDAQWDPVTEQFLFVGQGHYASKKFVVYDARANAWRNEPEPPWGGIGHAYDQSAINPADRFFYHRPYGSTTVYKYNIDSKTWGSLPQLTGSVMEYNNCCVSIDYFPEMHRLLYFSLESGNNGSLIGFNATSNQWVRVGPGKNLPCGGYQHFTEYNPVHKVFWFGGGNGSTANYKVDSLGNITILAAAPVGLGIMATLITVDPVSGLYLVFTSNGEFYTFNILTGAWVRQSGTVPFYTPSRSGPIWCTVAAPVATYGVNMFLKFYYGTPNQAWAYIYRHSAGQTGSLRLPSRGSDPGLSVSPNPFNTTVKISARRACEALDIYTVTGTLARSFAGASAVWDASGMPAGLYLLKARNGNRHFTQKLLLQK